MHGDTVRRRGGSVEKLVFCRLNSCLRCWDPPRWMSQLRVLSLILLVNLVLLNRSLLLEIYSYHFFYYIAIISYLKLSIKITFLSSFFINRFMKFVTPAETIMRIVGATLSVVPQALIGVASLASS